MTQANWIKSSEKECPVNVPVLLKVKGINEVVYGWKCARDGQLEVFGYYKEYLVPTGMEYEWCMLPK